MLGAEVRQALEFAVNKLNQHPNPNKDTWLMNDNQILDTFWTEFADFRNRQGVFGVATRWQGCHVRADMSQLWHEKYSLHYTKVLGFVGCRVTSKNSSIGMCERNWGDVKEIKSGKRSGLSGESTEKRALIYTTARVKEARLRMQARETRRADNVDFEDQDLAFDQELEKVGVMVRELKRPGKEVCVPTLA